ncbi:deoxynucleotidyltransferase terminal-interacting protein 2 [Pyxicephalus adspersus]|uniref:Fcf2 pre-rRNA processing C-terminal domain-containing protein n=1 Tax=Pyxicephalus adspersus TaxID=30357 RepID=A0AAV2ZZ16_PYXAD|nr:TPA: hypothetical protein GDO54_004447 [Pyxicephalus adspersus]
MVATRRGTRLGTQEESERSNRDQAAVELTTTTSPKPAQKTIRSDSPSQDSGRINKDQGKSTVSIGSPTKDDSRKGPSQVVTRSRRRSGQSDADISEAESTTSNSSTRIRRSRKSLGNITDSTRKLGIQLSVITEPILESKEDEELSETESYCSSVSTRAARRTHASATRSIRTRSRKTALISEPDFDNSEAESNCSSVSGLQKSSARSTKKSEATRPVPGNSESQKEEISEAESFSSDFVSQNRLRRSSRRVQRKPKSGEDRNSGETSSQEQESPKKQRYSLRGAKDSEHLSPGKEEQILSTPRSSRNRIVSETSEVIILSDSDSESKNLSSKASHEEQPKESLKEQANLSEDHSSVLDQKLPKTFQSTQSDSDEVVDLTEELLDGPQLTEQDEDKSNADDDNSKTAEVEENVNISLLIDNDESEEEIEIEKKEIQEEMGEESEKEMEEEEESQKDSVKKGKLKQTKTKQIQDLVDDGLFVIDTDPGLNSRKKYYLDNDVDDKASEKEPSEKEELSEPEEDLSEPDEENQEELEEMEKESEDEMEEDEMENKEELEEEESQKDLVKKGKPKQTKSKPVQDLVDDGLFVIDTDPGLNSSKKYYLDNDVDDKASEKEPSEKEELPEPEEDLLEPDEEEEDFIDEEVDDIDEEDELLNKPKRSLELSTSIDTGLNIKKLGGLYISFDAEKSKPGSSLLNKMKKESKQKDELLKKSVITPDFEKKESAPPYRESLKQLKKKRKMEREKTTGKGWFDMKAPEMTEELKNDLKALKMRSAMDPKRFYKKNDREGFPKYFQVGTVVDSPLDFYNSRIPKKQRKRTIVEELLADAEFRSYNKKKYQEIIAEKAARAEGKKNRKKKKFRT